MIQLCYSTLLIHKNSLFAVNSREQSLALSKDSALAIRNFKLWSPSTKKITASPGLIAASFASKKMVMEGTCSPNSKMSASLSLRLKSGK